MEEERLTLEEWQQKLNLSDVAFEWLTELIEKSKLVSDPPRTGLTKCRLEDFET